MATTPETLNAGSPSAPATPAITYPIGAIIAYAGTEASLETLPQGWLLCDGAPCRIGDAEYQALQDVIGTMYGGDGNNFYLPDYRGRFHRGVDGGRGVDPDAATRTAPAPGVSIQGNTGDNVGSFQADAFPSHTHVFTIQNQERNAQANQSGAMTIRTDSKPEQTSAATGAGDTRPINLSVFYLIRYSN